MNETRAAGIYVPVLAKAELMRGIIVGKSESPTRRTVKYAIFIGACAAAINMFNI